MGQFGKMIAASSSITMRYSEAMLKDVKAEQFARFASPGGVVVKSNHGAFVYGHLALYPARLMGMLGLPEGVTAKPAGWDELFKAGVECVDDPKGTIYPSMETLIKFYFNAYTALVAAIGEVDDSVFSKPNPAEGRFKEMLPLMGSVAMFMVGAHPMSHLGQVSAWRRMIGLGSAM